MISVEKPNILEYEEINQKIKDNLLNKYKFFNKPEISRYFIPITNKETKEEISKECYPKLNSLKNKIVLDIRDIKNEIKSFRLNNYTTNDIKSNISKSNYEINLLNNKIKILIHDVMFSNNLMKNHIKEKSMLNINLISKKNKLSDNIDDNNKILSLIEKNQNEIKQNSNDCIEKHLSQLNLLDNLRKKYGLFIEEFNNDSFSNNQEIFNKFEKYINSNKIEIEVIQNNINIIKNNIEKLKKIEKDINEVTNINNIVINNRNLISNEIYNKLGNFKEKLNNLETNAINNINKINDYNEKIMNISQMAMQNEQEIIKLNVSYAKKRDVEEKIKEINKLKVNIELVNNKQNNDEMKLKNLSREIENKKKMLLDCVRKNDSFVYLDDLNKKIGDISNNYKEKKELIGKEEKKIDDSLEKYFEAQKARINNIKEEKNNKMEEISKLKMEIDENLNKKELFKENKIKIDMKLTDINERITKINKIKDKINKDNIEIKDINTKLLELEKKIRNEPIENNEYRNSVLKNLNNCIYENNKNMNEMIKKGLINKNKKNNLLIMLNDIEKNIIKHNKYYNDLIDNFIDKQNKINKRNEKDINYINNKESSNNIEIINYIENNIDEISGKYNELVDEIIKGHNQAISSKKGELLEFQKKINKELNEIELYIDEKINNYKNEDSNNLEFSSI